jgi:hypothetical protein
MGNEMPEGKKFNGEYAREMAKRSAETRKKNKSVRELMQMMLNSNLTKQQVATMLGQFDGLDDIDVNYKVAIGYEQMKKALKGDTQSAKFVFDYAGEQPADNVNAEVKIPQFNINVTDNKEVEEEFEKYETNTETD